jgi:hypothetical protein
MDGIDLEGGLCVGAIANLKLSQTSLNSFASQQSYS